MFEVPTSPEMRARPVDKAAEQLTHWFVDNDCLKTVGTSIDPIEAQWLDQNPHKKYEIFETSNEAIEEYLPKARSKPAYALGKLYMEFYYRAEGPNWGNADLNVHQGRFAMRSLCGFALPAMDLEIDLENGVAHNNVISGIGRLLARTPLQLSALTGIIEPVYKAAKDNYVDKTQIDKVVNATEHWRYMIRRDLETYKLGSEHEKRAVSYILGPNVYAD